MRDRQFCTPHLVNLSAVTRLERVKFNERTIRESWLQNLLFKNPSIIPIDEIEPVFGPMIPVAREMPTDKGPVDIVYISATGYLTLVETKLFRSPEARRIVVAQILDYAAAVSKWTYEDLCNAVRAKRRWDENEQSTASAPHEGDKDPIKALVCDHPDYDEALFIDSVSRNLAQGRFLLLIVGDGIQSGVEHLTETLAKTPALGFSLALIELALFKTGTSDEEYFVQPRVLARTREVVRAVIELRAPLTSADIKVTLPEIIIGGKGGDRRRLTEEAMVETIAASLGKPVVDQFREFLTACERIGLEVDPKGTSLTLAWYEPNTERRFAFASVYADGGIVDLRFVQHNYRKSGIDQSIGLGYVNAVAALVPDAKTRENFKEGKAWPRVFVGGREITLADLMPKSEQWLGVLREVIAKTEAAGAAKVSSEPA